MINLSAKIRKLISYLFIVLLLNGFALNAKADGAFLLQLGSFDSKSEATQKWRDAKKHNPELAKLSLHISEIAMPPSNVITYRVQVGTLNSRSDADSICDKLQNKGTDCLVVETALLMEEVADEQTTSTPQEKTVNKVVTELAPKNLAEEADSGATITNSKSEAKSINTTSEKPHLIMVAGREPKFLDDAPIKVTQIAEPKADFATNKIIEKPAERKNFFERLFSSSDESQQTTSNNAQPVTSKEETPVKLKPLPSGDVEVAEAIRVPLSKDDNTKSHYQISQSNTIGGASKENSSQNYWVQINYFANEAQAQGFYDDFRSANPNLSDGIRMRVTHPYSRNSNKVSLRVGPFISKEDIKSICGIANDAGLRCTSVKELVSNIASNTQKEKTLSNEFNKPLSSNYYAQLGSFESYDDAIVNWETLRKENKKILGKFKPVIRTPEQNSSNSPVYRLQVGPFTNQKTAYSMCDSLWQAGENCLILNAE